MSTNNRVLAIDDDAMILETIAEAFSDADWCELRTANSGEEGIEIYSDFKPNVILLDIKMPGIDGYDVCRIIRNDMGDKLVKIIMVTGVPLAEDQMASYNGGADDYLLKPFSNDELIAKVKAYLVVISSEQELLIKNQELKNRLEEQSIKLENISSVLDKFINRLSVISASGKDGKP